MEYIIKIVYSFLGLAGALIGSIAGLSGVILYLFLSARYDIFKKAKACYSRGNPQRALELIAVELQKKPSNSKALLLKADIELKQELYEAAEKDYYSLLDLKTSGDGIDVFDVKKKLLSAAFNQEKLYESFKLINELLAVESGHPEILYYLGLIYLGQLYCLEGYGMLERVIQVRPMMHEALHAGAVALSMLRRFEEALALIKRALSSGRALRADERALYNLTCAAVYYFSGNFKSALHTLESIERGELSFSLRKQAQFYRQLKAMCRLMTGNAEEAFAAFRQTHEEMSAAGGKKAGVVQSRNSQARGNLTYNEFGKIREKIETESPNKPMSSDVAREFYQLKEVAKEEGRWPNGNVGAQTSASNLLDIQGLSPAAWSALNVGFAHIKAGRFSEARELFNALKAENPEVLGCKKLISLLKEKESERILSAKKSGVKAHDIEQSTKRVIKRAGRRYELQDYIEVWEKNAIRPYHMLVACGLAASKRLNPTLLFKQ